MRIKMSRQKYLQKFFQGGDAESEKEILEAVFVKPKSILKLLDFGIRNSKVLIGQKGVGKSMILQAIQSSVLASNSISILIDPSNLSTDEIYEGKTYAEKLSRAKKQLSNAIIGAIGNSITLSAFPSESRIVKLSEQLNARPIDWGTKLATILAECGPAETTVWAKGILASQNMPVPTKVIYKDVEKFLETRNKSALILIDNIDLAINRQGGAGSYEAAWAIIDAAIRISNEIKCVNSLISVRRDVWHIMTKVKKLGSDIYDKIGIPASLEYNEEQIEKFWVKRMQCAKGDASTSEDYASFFFNHPVVNLPGTSEINRPWGQWISKSSRNRPRDMVALMQQLIEAAIDRESQKIDTIDAINIMPTFSETRIDYLQREYEEICPQLRDAIDYVCEKMKSTDVTYEEYIEVLKTTSSYCSITIDGKALQPGRLEDAISLMRILHMANFINPKIPATGEKFPKGFRHISFEIENSFVGLEKLAKLQGARYELHPAFHDYFHKTRNARRDIIQATPAFKANQKAKEDRKRAGQ